MTRLRTAHPYQDEGSTFLAARARAALTDDPGLGKTLQAIRAAALVKARTTLVVCPAIARISWRHELSLEHPNAQVIVIDGMPPRDRFAFLTEPSFVVVSWDALSRKENEYLHHALRDARFDLCILDEAHYAKNRAANRTRTVYGRNLRMTGILRDIPRVWLLSGTLAPNHAGELYPHVAALFPEVFAAAGLPDPCPQDLWEDRFCKVSIGHYGRQIHGSRNLTSLKDLLSPHMLRRRKDQVLPELPPMTVVDEYLDPDVLSPNSRRLVTSWQDTSGATTDLAFLAWLAKVNDETASISTRRLELGLGKAPAAALWARNLLEGGCKKLILFAWHQSVIDLLMEQLSDFDPVRIDGRDNAARRAHAIDLFQTDPRVRIFIGQMQAAGTAITLTAASDVAMVECSWVPSDNFQAACRAHRIGQRDGVLVRYLAVPGTLDERIMATFRRKASELATLFA